MRGEDSCNWYLSASVLAFIRPVIGTTIIGLLGIVTSQLCSLQKQVCKKPIVKLLKIGLEMGVEMEMEVDMEMGADMETGVGMENHSQKWDLLLNFILIPSLTRISVELSNDLFLLSCEFRIGLEGPS